MARLTRSRYCPRCGALTRRIRTPWFIRPLRWIFKTRSSTRSCAGCGWKGFVVMPRV